jgi:hypothetical protein
LIGVPFAAFSWFLALSISSSRPDLLLPFLVALVNHSCQLPLLSRAWEYFALASMSLPFRNPSNST